MYLMLTSTGPLVYMRDWLDNAFKMQQRVGTSKGIDSINILFQAFLSSEFTCLCVLLNILQFCWKPFFCWTEFVAGYGMVALRFFCFEVMDVTRHSYSMLQPPALTVFPDCIQSIAAAWRTVRETESGRERGWCTTTPLTASQWDSTWELPSAPCAWILCTLVAKLLPVSVSYRWVGEAGRNETIHIVKGALRSEEKDLFTSNQTLFSFTTE